MNNSTPYHIHNMKDYGEDKIILVIGHGKSTPENTVKIYPNNKSSHFDIPENML